MLISRWESLAFESFGVESWNERGWVVTLREVFIVYDWFTEADIVSDTLHNVLVECFIDERHGSFSVFTPRD